MKIKTFQGGGSITNAVYNPVYRPQTKPTSAPAQPQQATKKQDNDLWDKALLDLMKENGLNSDTEYFLSAVTQISKAKDKYADHIRKLQGYDVTQDFSDFAAQYSQVYALANQVKRNKEIYEKAVSNLNEKDAWGNLAIDASGRLYCFDPKTEGIKMLTASEYAKQKDKVQALTNTQLMSLRENNTRLALRSDMLDSLNDCVSVIDMNKRLQDAVKSFATSEYTYYGVKAGDQISRGMEAITEAFPDGLYKIKRVMTGKAGIYTAEDGTQYTQDDIAAAMNFLANNLSDREKSYLTAQGARMEEYEDKPAGYIGDFILTAMTPNMVHSVEYDYQDNLDIYGRKSGGGTSGSTKTQEMSRLDQIVHGSMLGEMKYGVIMPYGSAQMNVPYMSMGTIKDKNNNGVGPTTLANLQNRDGDAIALDFDNVYFGGMRLNAEELNSVVYNGKDTMYRVLMPVNKNGEIDFDTFNEIERLNDQIGDQARTALKTRSLKDFEVWKQKPENQGKSVNDYAKETWEAAMDSIDPEITKMIKEYNDTNPAGDPDLYYDATIGSLVCEQTKAFMMVSGYTYAGGHRKSGDLWTDKQRMDYLTNPDNPWLTHVKSSSGDVDNFLDQTITAAINGTYVDGKYDKDAPSRGYKDKHLKEKDLYNGAIFITINDNANLTAGNISMPAAAFDYNVQSGAFERERQQGQEQWTSTR